VRKLRKKQKQNIIVILFFFEGNKTHLALINELDRLAIVSSTDLQLTNLGEESPAAGGKWGFGADSRRWGNFYIFILKNTHFWASFGLNFCLKRIFKWLQKMCWCTPKAEPRGACPHSPPYYATVFKTISTGLRIHSFMYLIFCAYY